MNQQLLDEIKQEALARERKLAIMSKFRKNVGNISKSARQKVPMKQMNQDIQEPLSQRTDIKI